MSDVQREAKQLRDRAFTHLDGLMADIRGAGRYAFRQDSERQAAFASAYLRRRRRAARRRAQRGGAAAVTTTATTV